MWESLKKILKTSNEKAVIIEDGKLKYVVLSIDEYMRLTGTKTSAQDLGVSEQIFDTPNQKYATPTTANQPNSYLEPKDASSIPIDLSDINVSEELPPIELSGDSDLGIEDLIF